MNHYQEIDGTDPSISPLELLYIAYTDQRPTVNQVITGHSQALEQYLAPLSQQDRDTVLQLICEIFSETERLAFLSGIHVGVRLEDELSNI